MSISSCKIENHFEPSNIARLNFTKCFELSKHDSASEVSFWWDCISQHMIKDWIRVSKLLADLYRLSQAGQTFPNMIFSIKKNTKHRVSLLMLHLLCC